LTSAIPPGRVTDHPGYLLKRAQAALNAAMAGALREHGATLSQYAVLTALDEEPGLSNAGLARRSFVTPQTMNQVLRELEQKGWVARHPHPGHARILQADLTPAGRTALGGCHRAVTAIEEQMLAPLAPGDVKQFAAALRACIQALSRDPPR
jgi:DNA-binding MarR family transcriptional regulator